MRQPHEVGAGVDYRVRDLDGGGLVAAKLDSRSIELRREVIRILQRSRRGHVGSSFSLIEITRVLFDDVLRFDPSRPRWADRDRLVFSKGHGCLALYIMLADKGFFPKEELYRFCGFGSILGGHPEYGKTPGVETSTGALGHGLPMAVGMALAARIDRKTHRVFAVLGDGECDEGSVWEAAMSAGKHRLDSLTVLVDYNKMQSYGPTSEVQDLEPFADKWRSFGFEVREVDGHDVAALKQTLGVLPFMTGRPGVLICHTVKGRGVPTIENDPEWHHKSRLKEEELALLVSELEAQA